MAETGHPVLRQSVVLLALQVETVDLGLLRDPMIVVITLVLGMTTRAIRSVGSVRLFKFHRKGIKYLHLPLVGTPRRIQIHIPVESDITNIIS